MNLTEMKDAVVALKWAWEIVGLTIMVNCPTWDEQVQIQLVAEGMPKCWRRKAGAKFSGPGEWQETEFGPWLSALVALAATVIHRGTKFPPGVCPRCGGNCKIPAFAHVNDGMCGLCKGTGTYWTRAARNMNLPNVPSMFGAPTQPPQNNMYNRSAPAQPHTPPAQANPQPSTGVVPYELPDPWGDNS